MTQNGRLSGTVVCDSVLFSPCLVHQHHTEILVHESALLKELAACLRVGAGGMGIQPADRLARVCPME